MPETDLQLLARYTRDHAEDAFAKIVRRHLDLVFSAALRKVRSPQLAEEAAQLVFTKLARQANGLAPDTILTAWLYQVTRCTAIDIVRHEVRRQFREQVASELIAMNAISDDWTQIEPLLDDAMLALEDIDRTAVLLRFFENKSLREVGQALGTNEDNNPLRALDQSLKHQSSQLAELSAENERLSESVRRTKGSESLSPTELQELLRLRSEVAQLQGTIKEMDQIRSRIARLRDRLQDAIVEGDSGRENDTALLADELDLRKGRVARLKHWLEGMPQEKIPELQFISEQEWMNKVDSPLITDSDYREAIGLLRADAESRFMAMAFKALKQYAKVNDGQFPSDIRQLQPFFPSPIDDAILQRFEIVPANSLIPDLAQTGGDWLITQKAPVNKSFDMRLAIGLTGFRMQGGGSQWDPLP